MNRRLVITSLAMMLVAGGSYAIAKLTFGGLGIPKEFQDARLSGAIAAQNIVNLSGQSTSDLQKVNDLVNKDQDYVGALNLVTQIITQSHDIRNQANMLSNDLQAMTQSLSSVQSFEARQAALEAISNRLALMSRLVNYSNDLGQLLELVRGELSGTYPKPGEVQTLVNDINGEVQAINSFNAQANQAMNRFDGIVSK